MCMKNERERLDIMVREREMEIKGNTKIANRGFNDGSRGRRVIEQVY